MFSNKLTIAIKQGMEAAKVVNTFQPASSTPTITRVPPEFVGTGVDISFVINAQGKAVPCIKLLNPRRTRRP